MHLKKRRLSIRNVPRNKIVKQSIGKLVAMYSFVRVPFFSLPVMHSFREVQKFNIMQIAFVCPHTIPENTERYLIGLVTFYITRCLTNLNFALYRFGKTVRYKKLE
jgi:hypothetical protein